MSCIRECHTSKENADPRANVSQQFLTEMSALRAKATFFRDTQTSMPKWSHHFRIAIHLYKISVVQSQSYEKNYGQQTQKLFGNNWEETALETLPGETKVPTTFYKVTRL